MDDDQGEKEKWGNGLRDASERLVVVARCVGRCKFTVKLTNRTLVVSSLADKEAQL